MPVSIPGAKERLGAIAGRGRSAIKIALGVLAWFVVVGLAIAGFSPQVAPRHRFEFLKDEVVGFATAFAVAGTIAGLVASATSRRRRWTIAFGASSLVVLAAAVPILRWWILHYTATNVAWGRRVWGSALGVMEAGLILGVFTGLVISGVVLMAAVVERRTARWQFGLIVAVTTAVLGMGVLPVVMSHVSDLIELYSGPYYRYIYERAMAGTAIGAGTGALVGAVVVGMIARLFATAEPARERPTAEARVGGPAA